MPTQYAIAILTTLLSSLPSLIALAAGVVLCALNLHKRPKVAMAGLIGFAGFLVLEIAMPVLNFALMGLMIKMERMRQISMIQSALRILSSFLAAALWGALIYGLLFAGKKDAARD